MKRKLFIGSSSEGKVIALKLKQEIESELNDWLECDLWDGGAVFDLNASALDSLMKASRKYDYGILVATKDDITKSRGKETHTPRDNVMFEMGMFLGSLGFTRAFLLVEKHSKLPTDYNGITVPYFESDIEGSLEAAVQQIKEAIILSQQTYNLRPVASAALALGYFENFVQKLAKKRLEDDIPFSLKIVLPGNINDIHSTTLLYKRNNPSDEIGVFEKTSRPIINRYRGATEAYWDIPTTLQTLNKLINMIIPSSEIGMNPEKQDWISTELRNFKGTLEVLIELCPASRGNVSVLPIQTNGVT
ncbi:MAG: hypothetical protein A3D31_10030 [Candidatus Fluviicola riflensis]|nr:MAG: hypothetical protein CHH17_14445 [Candidatus Fluviicola riflensis]OGS77342.1 MAG: hypothetical protein A3D31_10030 [Candidatus Fluviicola riflensis]OGS83922.1 MAG: hypothetical protein A3E30_11430 [Fluviicola sp. RIFCSPHIGHO2_12_FULL_43_24]OGS84409.1 MAG: hypothetical protein A2724_06970 [Fluviicola sp. RIFCSPHIGHO2_01_FULL_43_53]